MKKAGEPGVPPRFDISMVPNGAYSAFAPWSGRFTCGELTSPSCKTAQQKPSHHLSAVTDWLAGTAGTLFQASRGQ